MNYAEMSDFEINKAVAATCLGEWYDNGTCLVKCDDDDRSIFNPCNSWTDAGPIILENRIGLTPSVDIWHAYSDEEDFICSIANPLRAAMIVFLMMHEAANA